MQIFFVGDANAYQIQPLLDGAPWTLTGGTVTLFLLPPGGTALQKSATISGTQATYTDEPSSLTTAGTWLRWWTITVGSITKTSPFVRFLVQPTPPTMPTT